MLAIAEQLPRAGIRRCAVVLYEEFLTYTYPQSAPEWSRMILAFDEQGCHDCEETGIRFLSHRLLPENSLFQRERYAMVVMPLYFQELHMGFVLFETHPFDHYVYETLRSDIAAALWNVMLMEENRSHQERLEQLVTELKTTLENLQRTQTQLIQAEKMAALGKLIANIAHEINSPLGAINASNDIIARAFDDVVEQLLPVCQNLEQEQRPIFSTFLARAVQDKPLLTSREERTLRRKLREELEGYGLARAESIADALVDIGLVDDIVSFLPLLQSEQADQLLQTVYNLAIQRHQSTNIGLAVERASKVVFALKTYAHHNTSDQKIAADVRVGLDVVLTLYHNQLKHNIEVIKHYGDIPQILCYPNELNQIWINLIHNAIQAMEGKGRLEITVTCQESSLPSTLQEGGPSALDIQHPAPGPHYLVISFTDSGPGIPEEIKDQIFEPFFTTKPAGEGSGLGLDICKKITDKYQGKIDFESQPGCTTFRVWLPVRQ
jgi:signal transduction histidine kinase